LIFISGANGVVYVIDVEGNSKTFVGAKGSAKLQAIQFNSVSSILAANFSDGTANVWFLNNADFMIWMSQDSPHGLLDLAAEGFEIVPEGDFRAIDISLHTSLPLLAIGNSDGTIDIHELGSPVHSRRISIDMKSWDLSLTDVGIPTQLAWSGTCLAVGFQTRGLFIFSRTGSRLFSSITDTSSAMRKNEPFANGVLAMSWDKCGFDLLVSSKKKLAAFSIAKLVHSNFPVLLCSDRLLLLRQTYLDTEDDSCWDQITLPSSYLVESWPIETLVISNSGEQVCIAGKLGAALYNMNSSKWRLFGNVNHEKKVHVLAASWFGEQMICIANASDQSLIFYPRTHLDNSSIIAKYKLPVPIQKSGIESCTLSIEPASGFSSDLCCMLLSDNSIFCMQLHCLFNNRPYSSLLIDSVALDVSKDVVKIEFVPVWKLTHDSPLSSIGLLSSLRPLEYTSIIALSRSGSLLSFDKRKDALVVLEEDVIQFWTRRWNPLCSQKIDSEASDVETGILWTYTKDTGLEIWFRHFPDEIKQSTPASPEEKRPSESPVRRNRRTLLSTNFSFHREVVFNHDPDVVPAYVDHSVGTIAAIRPFASVNDESSGVCFYSIQTSVLTYGDVVLRYLLLNTRIPTSWITLSVYFSFDNPNLFPLFYEMLLHFTVENELSRPNEDVNLESSQFIARVWNFLRQCPHYPKFVANCARKTDASLWKRLFPHIGEPLHLFEQCLSENQLEAAGMYLLILQRWNGTEMAVSSAYKLLKALKLDKSTDPHATQRLVLETVRFIQMCQHRSPSQSTSASNTSSPRLHIDIQELIGPVAEEIPDSPRPGVVSNVLSWFGF